MRLDKFLKVSHIIKRRTIAKEIADSGHIYINGKVAKPSNEINIGDLLEIHLSGKINKYKIKDIRNTARLENTNELYEILEEQL